MVFKSDVSQAYCRIPVHPLWQLFQVVTIDGVHHVDCNNNFGNCAAGGLWGTFMETVLWITSRKRNLDMCTYVDDCFSWSLASDMLFYAPYKKFFPTKQSLFLLLLDELGVPHDEPKQVFGPYMTIIGFEVDPNAMTICMPKESHNDLLSAVRAFA